MENRVKEVLRQIIHPDTETDIVEAGIVHDLVARENLIVVALQFKHQRDPFALKIRQSAETALTEAFPGVEISCYINKPDTSRRKPPKSPFRMPPKSTTESIDYIIAVTSGKGGVGKSTVTANLAITLQMMGFKVGILDADVYGPSQTKLFGTTEQPCIIEREGKDYIDPVKPFGVPMMSMSMFVKYGEPIIWRGTMAHSALRQFLHETDWGELDFLLIDMPPGTGDIHLSITGEVKLTGAVVVTTPQEVAMSAVERGINMFRHKEMNVPILGIVENMAWFTPSKHPDERYYIFGKEGGVHRFAKKLKIEELGQIPMVETIMQCGDKGTPAVMVSEIVKEHYQQIAQKIVEKVGAYPGFRVNK